MSERHLKEQRCPAGDIADHWHGSPALAGGYSILSRQCFFLSANTWPLLSLTCNLISLGAWGSCKRRENLLNIYRKVFCFCPTAKNHQEKILFPLVWARNLFMKLNSCFLLAMLSFGKSSWSQYYHPFPSGFTFYCKHSLVAIDLQRWLVLGVGNSHAFLLLCLELIVLLSLSTGMMALRTFFQSPLRPGTPLTLVVPELNMLPVASPKGSILPGWWDLQEASAEGEPGGKWGPPASPGHVAAGAMGLCPWGGQAWPNHASISLAGNGLRDFWHSRAAWYQTATCPGGWKSAHRSVKLDGSDAYGYK